MADGPRLPTDEPPALPTKPTEAEAPPGAQGEPQKPYLTLMQGGPGTGAPLPPPAVVLPTLTVPELPPKKVTPAKLPKQHVKPPTRALAETDVYDQLERTKDHKVLTSIDNLRTILMLDTRWRNRIWYDEFARAAYVEVPRGATGWYERSKLTNTAITRARLWVKDTYGIDPKEKDVGHVIHMVAREGENSVHPVRAYLEACAEKWDGQSRLRELLCGYFGAEDIEINAIIGLRFLISAVARIMEPGCQVDSMLVLYGEQGIGKSGAVKILAVHKAWWSDTEIKIGGFNDNNAYTALHGKWLYEIAEMSSFKTANAKSVRAFITSSSDNYRAVWERTNDDWPRQNVFIGTTNVQQIIADATGSRRFWPVEVTQVDFAGLTKDRDQIWGEAVHWYRAGEQWHLTYDEGKVLDAGLRGAAEKVDPWFDAVAEYIERSRPNMPVWIGDLMVNALQMGAKDQTNLTRARVEECLRSLGYRAAPLKVVRIPGHGQHRSVWFPPGYVYVDE